MSTEGSRAMQGEDIERLGRNLSPRAYLATCGPDREPDVVPVHPGWEGSTIWIMTGRSSVKVANIAHNPSVALHWETNGRGDGLLVWGRASLHDEPATKRRLWHGVFDYDLDLFASDGQASTETVFIGVEPSRAIHALAYGAAGIRRWRAARDV